MRIDKVGNGGSHTNTFLVIVFRLRGYLYVSLCGPVHHTYEFVTLPAYFEESPYPGSALFALFVLWW